MGTNLAVECGSKHYMAPEVFHHQYSQSADMWSLGVMAFMMLTGSSPWRGRSDVEIRDEILDAQPCHNSRFASLSPEARDFIGGLLDADVRTRLDADSALSHPWIVEHCSQHFELTVVDNLRAFANAPELRKVFELIAMHSDQEENPRVRHQFLALAGPSGTITLPDLDVGLSAVMSEDDAQNLFAGLDISHKNEISYTEFLCAACPRAHNDVTTLFNTLDVGNSGCVSTSNLRKLFGTTSQWQQAAALLRSIDSRSGMTEQSLLSFMQEKIELPERSTCVARRRGSSAFSF